MLKQGVFAAVLAVVALTFAATAEAKAPTDPQAGGQQNLQIMRVPQAMDDLAVTLQNVPVSVIDTGIDLDHPDLAAHILPASPGSDLLGDDVPPCIQDPGNEDPDSTPDDPLACGGHGTLVAGVMGAVWNNGVGGAGVAPNALFVPERACWDDDTCYQYNTAAAIEDAVGRGARVITFSWLVGDGDGSVEDELRDAIGNHPNTLFVAIPSGNGTEDNVDGDQPEPCSLPFGNVVCVTSSSTSDASCDAAFGPTVVDVAVPPDASVTTSHGGGFTATSCATSFASPNAGGVAAILLGIDPNMSGSDVRQLLIDSARKTPYWQGKSVSGGVVDADAAVRLLETRLGIKIPTATKCKKKHKKKHRAEVSKKKHKKCKKKGHKKK